MKWLYEREKKNKIIKTNAKNNKLHPNSEMSQHLKNLRAYQFSLDRYDNEAYTKNPLLTFSIGKIKQKRLYESIKRKAALEKIRLCSKPKSVESITNKCDVDISETVCLQIIHDAVATAPIPKILFRIKRKIIDFVPEQLHKKYSNIVKEYMNDVTENYNETIKLCNLRRFLVQSRDTTDAETPKPFKFKRLGRTSNYKKFHRNRKLLQENLFLPYPFIRYILNLSKLRFPSVLNDYGNYTRNKNGAAIWLTLIEFETIVQRDLESNTIFLKEEWYPKIVRILLKYYNKRFLSPQAWPRALACAKGLINRQITELKVDTFEHIFNVLQNRSKIPPIKFQIICSNSNIELYPNFDEVLTTYRNIFFNIAAIATRFPLLEPLIDRSVFIATENYLKIEIGDIFMNDMLKRLEIALKQAYTPILAYVELFAEKYLNLYSDDTKNELTQFLAEPKKINEYLSKIGEFREYISNLQKTVQNEYFDIATINQTKAIMGLRTIAQDYINEITAKIVQEHQKDCYRICDWFNGIKKRAFEAPKSTETLLANGEFMLQVKNKKMIEIQEHIQSNLKISGKLVELTEFTADHIELQVLIVQWITNIQDIFEQNSSQFEIYKNQFEEHLGVVTKKLIQDINDLVPKLAIIDDMYETEKLRNYHSTLKIYTEQLHCFEDYIRWINKEEKLFKLPVSQYPILEELKNYVEPFAALVKLCIEWLRYYYIWMDGPFEYLDPVVIEMSVKGYAQEFQKTQKYYKNRIKQDMLGNPVLKFRGQTEDPDPEKHPVPLRLCSRMIDWINEFQIGVYIVKIMCNPALRDRHWVEMSEIAGFNLMPDAGTSLRKITKFGIDHLLANFEIISIGANKELQLQNDLNDMLKQWNSIQFPISHYKETEIKILANIEDIQVMLDDHIIKTLTMRGSAFVKPCKSEVRTWYDKLLRVNRVFDEWIKVQTNWLYLLPILSSEDILNQMPAEGQLFAQVNEIYCKYINMAVIEPLVMEMANTVGLLEALIRANEMLDEIKNGVNAYLERKRLYFPRFFFLSNNEMLKILSETKNPQHVQPFLTKCFEGIHRLEIDSVQNIYAMLSANDEKVNFVNAIAICEARGSVERWLLNVEEEMKWTVKNELRNSYSDFLTTERNDWVLNWPQMIVLIISQIFWTSDVHDCLAKAKRELLSNVYQELQTNLDDITFLIRSNEISNLNRMTLKSLCILDVHAKDTVQRLLAAHIDNIDDFQWIAQMRYYWIDENVTVKLLNSVLSFGNEYLGNFQRVVVTPLTERCFRTVICAMKHHLNASLEGPTATGKSETIKDLTRALAIQCKVFNCSSSLDYRSIGQILKGVVSSGAWMCFKDFNRIHLKTLSVVAQQIRCIVMALRSTLQKFNFNGVELNLNANCFICIITNPDYTARSQLPDNLKVLFRPIAMMVPDLNIIAEVSLYSSGYENAKKLSIKIVSIYELCTAQLTKQNHYDFGLRNLKIVLRSCGQRKLENCLENEEALVYKSLMDVTLPKLNSADVTIFESIIGDLFLCSISTEKDYSLLRESFIAICNEKNLQPIDSLYGKLIETYEMMSIRHGIMLIGNPYTGKSTVLQILAKTLEMMFKNESNCFEIEYINPKSITAAHLFGEYDSVNLDWIDGIVSYIFRCLSFITKTTEKWVIFDGPIDSEWVENLNTLLDENKKLCLVSGEIIALNESCSIIFEVNSLTHASPATISRLGIIFLEPDILGWQTLTKSWINKCNPKWMNECKQFIFDLFEWIIPPMINYVTKNCTHLLNPLKYNVIATTLDIFQMVMDDAVEANGDDYQKFLMSWVQAATIFSIVWGVGGILNEVSRNCFDQFHRKVWNCSEEYPPSVSIKNRLDISIPSEGNLADYFYVFKQKGAWKLWADLVRRQEPEISQLGIHVVTVDSARYTHLLELHIKYSKRMLLVGPSGTGKTFLIQNMLLNKLDKNVFSPAFITFTISTTANEMHEQLLSKLVKLKRGVFGSPKEKKCIIFVDDMNLPAKEPYGSQASTELLRQMFDYNFVYDLKSTRKIFIENILMIAACGIPGGTWHDVNVRVLNHFNCFSINEFSEETMSRIFTNVLMNGLKKSGHATDVIGNVNQIVAATLHIYHSVIDKLKATPAKCHYMFNLRDVARVCTGCSLLRKESVDNKKMFTKIWFHEMMRVFHDRLIENSEREWIFSQLTEEIEETFKDSLDQLFETYVNDEGNVTLESMNKLVFGCYFDLDAEPVNRRYEETNFEKLIDFARSNLDEYNATQKRKLSVILFSYAVEHLNRICRIISIPGGNGLIIGMGDSGRKSLVKLAAFVCKQNLFQMKIVKNYELSVWKDDVKKVLKSAGGLGKPTIFLLSENQLTDDAFLTDIDHLLNSGDIPNLWPIDEKQELLEMVRLAAQGGNRNIDVSPAEVFAFFVNKCRQNLHLILCFSPIGTSLRTRIRLFPSLINRCFIDWYDAWPEEALEIVATKYISELDIPNELNKPILSMCKFFHSNAQQENTILWQETGYRNYITSASYVELIRCFAKLFVNKQNEIMEIKSRYVSGLETLLKAAEAVEIMQIELSELQPKLLAMAENCRQMTLEIEAKTLEASVATEQVKRDEVVANGQAAAAEAMEDECSKDLAQAVPVLEDALQALNTLKPADITLVKSMKNPPSAVKLVMAAVCVMKAVPPDRINDAASGKKIIDYWGPSKRILGDMGFLQSLKDYDKDDISPDIMKKIRKDFIPHKDFQPHVVAKASSAAEGLCKWIKAIENFESVNTVVMPKKMKLIKAKELLKETRKFLAEKRALAAELEAKVVGLNEALEKTNSEKERTEKEVDMCERKLSRAEALINSLGEEKNRWTEASENLQNSYDRLAGDILLSSGVIAYLGPFSEIYRENCILKWHEYCTQLAIPRSDLFSVRLTLGNENDIQNWSLDGLSMDDYSIENAIIMVNSCRPCLFVDPQRQANKWIKQMENGNHLKIVKFNQTDYFAILIDCMRVGCPILFEDINEDLDTVLDPILNYNAIESQGRIQLSDQLDVPVSDNFRLYLTCNIKNPHYLPETCNKVNIINFILASSGLEEKLLDIVVAKENPYLREDRDQLILDKIKDKALLLQYEKDVLSAIGESQCDILEDETAIRKMDDSKRLCIQIVEKQTTYIETEKKIECFCNDYKSVAKHATIIYDCLNDLPNIDQMYQFSLDWFINLYNFSIENANRSRDLTRRIQFLIISITKNLYNSVCRSIFEKDKLLFSWILTTKIMLADGRLNYDELKLFITNSDDRIVIGPFLDKPNKIWLTNTMWMEVNAMSLLNSFENFIESFLSDINDWTIFSKDSNKIPEPWRRTMSSFQKLMILKIFHPDQLQRAINEFISKEMGESFVNPPHFDIRKTFEESTILTPLIFILSPGTDPTEVLLRFAKRLGFSQSFQTIALGPDQELFAERQIEQAKKQGAWICLQNCHMVSEWLPKLENIWQNMNIYNTTSSFRLWLTSERTSKFPLNLLQNGIKLTYEQPKGIQNNLLHSYTSEPINQSNFYDGCPGKDKAFQRLLFSFCFFEAIIQERKHYGSVGWNVQYDFNECDFHLAVHQLKQCLNDNESTPYLALKYLIGSCTYGGRTTDAWDKRLFDTILSEYLCENVVDNPSHRFGSDDLYPMPRRLEYREIVKYINDSIPVETHCELFGLHANSDFQYHLKCSKFLLNSMATAMNLSKEIMLNTETELELLDFLNETTQKLPNTIDLSNSKCTLNTNDLMNTILIQEIEKYNQLATEIRNTCTELQGAIQGTLILTPELEHVCDKILNNKLPDRWQKVSYPSLKPISAYVNDFCERFQWFQMWWRTNKAPTTFWLSAFFHPHGFLTGVKQHFARKHNITMDKITFDFIVMPIEELIELPPDHNGVFIDKLYLEAAHWNGICIEEQLTNISREIMPTIHLKPVRIDEFYEKCRYECPLYKTAERRGIDNFIISFWLPAGNVDCSHWIKRSVALICETND